MNLNLEGINRVEFRQPIIKVVYLDHYPHKKGGLEYMSKEASGFDLRAAIEYPEMIYCVRDLGNIIYKAIPTGIKIALEPGYELQIRPRSGLAYKHGITIVNTPGTVDADYRGEIFVIMANLGNVTYIVEPGDRIAQAVVSPTLKAKFETVTKLPETKRGEGGFGHTGK